MHCTGLRYCKNAKNCEHAKLHRPVLVTGKTKPLFCNTCKTYCAHLNQIVTCK
jgi:hypothetical protein